MKIRTCPHCGYKYPFSHYYKKVLPKQTASSWPCANCGSELSFNIGRRTLVAIVSVIPIGFGSFITDTFQNIGLSKGLSWIGFALIFVIWAVLIYSFDTFTLIKKE